MNELQAPNVKLNYAAPHRVRLTQCVDNGFVRLALAFWALPLFAGVAVLLAWLPTRSQSLESAGIFILFAGTILGGCGLMLTVCFVAQTWKNSDNPWESTLLPAILLIVLIGMNFVIASGILRTVDWIDANHPTQKQIDESHASG